MTKIFYLVGNDDMVAVKMNGLPWRVEDNEIMEFFANFKPVENSVQLQLADDGRKNGWGSVLFND